MLWIRMLPQILAVVAVLGGVAWVGSLKLNNDRLRAENATLTSEITALNFNAEQKDKAIETLNAAAKKQAEETAVLRASVEDFLKGRDNVEVPSDIADFLNGLHDND